MLAEQLPSGAVQEQSCNVKAADETVRVEARSKTKTDMKLATSRFFIESAPPNTATNRTSTQEERFADRKLRPSRPTPLRDGLTALVTPDGAGRRPCPKQDYKLYRWLMTHANCYFGPSVGLGVSLS